MGKPKTPAPGARKTAAKSGRAHGATGAAVRGTAAQGTAAQGTPTRGVARGGRARASAAVALPAGGAALPVTVTRIMREHAGGAGKRKNMFVPQGLLDRARKALGVRTETEAVALGLGAAVDLAEFQQEMLAGFDRLMKTGGLSPVEGEEVVLDGFRARPAR